VSDLLRITKLCTIFDIEDDEDSAIAAFQHSLAGQYQTDIF
jgi:hypothetical protein